MFGAIMESIQCLQVYQQVNLINHGTVEGCRLPTDTLVGWRERVDQASCPTSHLRNDVVLQVLRHVFYLACKFANASEA